MIFGRLRAFSYDALSKSLLPSLRVLWRGNKVDGLPRPANLLAPVSVLLRSEAGHRYSFGTIKLVIARDSVDRFGRNPHNFEAFLIADLAITTGGHRTFVLDKFHGIQGSAWKLIFRYGP